MRPERFHRGTGIHAAILGLLLGVPMIAQQDPTGDGGPIRSLDIRLNGRVVHFLEAGSGPPVLLLHGGRFSAGTWRDLGTIELLAERGYRVIALDLPGFGGSERTDVPSDQFLRSFLPYLTDVSVVVVSPSMSGRFSFPLVTRHPGFVSGFVALAPVNIEENLEALRGKDLPALLIWGTEDQVVPVTAAQTLHAALVNSRLVTYEGAGHPAYLERPKEFHRELLAFLGDLVP